MNLWRKIELAANCPLPSGGKLGGQVAGNLAVNFLLGKYDSRKLCFVSRNGVSKPSVPKQEQEFGNQGKSLIKVFALFRERSRRFSWFPVIDEDV